MSKRPVKLTGFARFFFVMLFVVPLAFLGASYYNGEDGVAKLKKLLHIETAASEPVDKEKPAKEAVPVNQSPSAKALEEENKRLKEELDFKSKRVDELYRENEELKHKLEAKEKQ